MPAKGSPQITVNGSQVSGLASETPRVLFISPFFPNVHAACAQVCFVGIAGKKPEELFGNPAKRDSLGGDDGKACAQVEARLIAKVRNGAHSGAVLMLSAV